jgi:head-tail adaptor
MTIHAGTLRMMVSLQRRLEGVDAHGGRAVQWTTFGQWMIDLETLDGSENSDEGKRITPFVTHRANGRYVPLQAKDRLIYVDDQGRQRIFAVVACWDDSAGRKREMVARLAEEVGGSTRGG